MEKLAYYLFSHPAVMLLVFAGVMSFIIIIGLWLAGREQLKEDYDLKYRMLKCGVSGCEVTKVNFEKIKERFAELELFGCRDKERLDVLQREFEQRFEDYFDKMFTQKCVNCGQIFRGNVECPICPTCYV